MSRGGDELRAAVWFCKSISPSMQSSASQGLCSASSLAVVSAQTRLDVRFCLPSGSHQKGAAKVGLLGEGRLIAGVDKGLRDMCVNERRTVTVPPHLAYGSTGAGKQALGVSLPLPFQADLLYPHALLVLLEICQTPSWHSISLGPSNIDVLCVQMVVSLVLT